MRISDWSSDVCSSDLKQARDWGYQRLVANKVVLLADAAPPPIARVTEAGCASTLAFELSDGDERILVNCGGAALTGATIPADLARGLRTTPAHSMLVVADSNSNALLANGSPGKGVARKSTRMNSSHQCASTMTAHACNNKKDR